MDEQDDPIQVRLAGRLIWPLREASSPLQQLLSE